MKNVITFTCLCIVMIQNSFQYEIPRKNLLEDQDNVVNMKLNKVERKRRGLLGVQVLDLDVLSLGEGLTPATVKPVQSTTVKQSGKPISKPMVSCGRRLIRHTELITNGLPTQPGEWPWHAALYRLKTAGSEQQYICGGTLLSTTRVLTAGHCVMENTEPLIPERLFVVLGKYNLAGGDLASQERGVFDIVVHPEYSRQTVSNDIAILKLSSRVQYSDYIQPICLWSKSDTSKQNIVNKRGTVVGWGFNEDSALTAQLMKAEMPVAGDLECIKTNPSFYSQFISDNTFCAGNRNGSSACNGDSGGGMFFSEKGPDGEDTWSLRGIVSLSVSRKDRNVCDPNEYVVFTDAATYSDFIRNNL